MQHLEHGLDEPRVVLGIVLERRARGQGKARQARLHLERPRRHEILRGRHLWHHQRAAAVALQSQQAHRVALLLDGVHQRRIRADNAPAARQPHSHLLHLAAQQFRRNYGQNRSQREALDDVELRVRGLLRALGAGAGGHDNDGGFAARGRLRFVGRHVATTLKARRAQRAQIGGAYVQNGAADLDAKIDAAGRAELRRNGGQTQMLQSKPV